MNKCITYATSVVQKSKKSGLRECQYVCVIAFCPSFTKFSVHFAYGMTCSSSDSSLILVLCIMSTCIPGHWEDSVTVAEVWHDWLHALWHAWICPAHWHIRHEIAILIDLFYLPGFTFLVPAHWVVPDKIQEGHKTGVCVTCWFWNYCSTVSNTASISWQVWLSLQALNCHRLHILSGLTTRSSDSDAKLEETYVTNVRYAAERLEREGVMALIEAISIHAKPGCWLSDPARAARIVQQVAHPNLRLQFDIFHAQIVGGDLTRRLKDWAPIIGHVQIAQVCTGVCIVSSLVDVLQP